MNNWTEKETIVAFNLYCKLPFGKLNQDNTFSTFTRKKAFCSKYEVM